MSTPRGEALSAMLVSAYLGGDSILGRGIRTYSTGASSALKHDPERVAKSAAKRAKQAMRNKPTPPPL